jgi:hypothetical protein
VMKRGSNMLLRHRVMNRAMKGTFTTGPRLVPGTEGVPEAGAGAAGQRPAKTRASDVGSVSSRVRSGAPRAGVDQVALAVGRRPRSPAPGLPWLIKQRESAAVSGPSGSSRRPVG